MHTIRALADSGETEVAAQWDGGGEASDSNFSYSQGSGRVRIEAWLTVDGENPLDSLELDPRGQGARIHHASGRGRRTSKSIKISRTPKAKRLTPPSTSSICICPRTRRISR